MAAAQGWRRLLLQLPATSTNWATAQFTTSAVAGSSRLEQFLKGTYDPVAENQKKEGQQGAEGGEQSSQHSGRGRRAPGTQARKHAVEFARQRAQGEQRAQGSQGQRQRRAHVPGQQRSQQQGGRTGAGGPQVSAAAQPIMAEDLEHIEESDDELQETEQQDRRRRAPAGRKQAARASMLGTISDKTDLLSQRPGSGRGSRGEVGAAAGRGRGRGRGRAELFEPAQGRGAARKRKSAHSKTLAPAQDEVDRDEEGAVDSHPEDGLGLHKEADWHMVVQDKTGKDCTVMTLPTEKDDDSYTIDPSGKTMEDDWAAMSMEELRQQLVLEMNYTREAHEAWVRGPGRQAIEAEKQAFTGEGFKSEEEFEHEVAVQMQLFDTHTWVDDLYRVAKHRQIMLRGVQQGLFSKQEVKEEGIQNVPEVADMLATSAPKADKAIEGGSEASVEKDGQGEDAEDAEGASSAATSTDVGTVTESEAAVTADAAGSGAGEQAEPENELGLEGDLDAQLAEEIRLSMREQRMLAKFHAVREKSTIGVAPRRKGTEFNKNEFEMLTLNKTMDFVFPERPRHLDGSLLTERVGTDARRAITFANHPECMPGSGRPELFPASTEEQMSKEWFNARMDVVRDSVCHPLLGIHTDEDWEEFKERAYEDVPQLMAERVVLHRATGFSGLLGGFQEEKAFLHSISDEVIPEDHPSREAQDMFTEKIATNAQWEWDYKVRAVRMVARTLLRGDKFAAEREKEDKRRQAAAVASSSQQAFSGGGQPQAGS